jgi:hypothetical protein
MWPSCDETVTADSCRRVLISRKNTTLDWPLDWPLRHSRDLRSKRVSLSKQMVKSLTYDM